MQTEAIFEGIARSIIQEIKAAHHTIYVAVAWFTNKNIFDALVEKAGSGMPVYLMLTDDAINKSSFIDYKELEIKKSRVFLIGNGDDLLMHNKFCVIDNKTIITGSYNWSYKAETNFENIVITKDDDFLAAQFIKEFNRIKAAFYPEAEDKDEYLPFPIDKIIKRLEILKNLFLLEDLDDIENTSKKLEVYSFNTEIDGIINDIHLKSFADAIVKIQNFIDKYQQLVIWKDDELNALKLEIKLLENQLNAFYNEKKELEKFLFDFQHRHTVELGEIILGILKLRKLKFQNDKEFFEEAEKDEKTYKETFEIEAQKEIKKLSEDEKKELKKQFRRASILCHPDKVNDEFREEAVAAFIELNNAYNSSDLEKVSEILDALQKGNFKSKSETITEKDLLKVAIAKYKTKINSLRKEIIEIKESEVYTKIKDIDDFDSYFKEIKEQLKNEKNRLHKELQIGE